MVGMTTARIVPPNTAAENSAAYKARQAIGSLIGSFFNLTTPVWTVAIWWFNAWFLAWLFPTQAAAIEALTGQTVYALALMFAGTYLFARAIGLRKG